MEPIWLRNALEAHGISVLLPADHERIELPWSYRTVQVPRVHPVLALVVGGTVTYAGIPNKHLVSVPSLIDRVPAELAVASLVGSAQGGEAWWAIWGSETRGVEPSGGTPTAYPPAVATVIARISARARTLMSECDRRTATSGSPWRRDRKVMRGGLWDVVALAPDGMLRFVECKRADTGADRIRDNQRAFLEAALEEAGLEAFAVVSWHARAASRI